MISLASALSVLLIGLHELPRTSAEEQDQIRCSLRCASFGALHQGIHAKCKVSYPLQLNCSTREFQNVSSLYVCLLQCSSESPVSLNNVCFRRDLSESDLTRVPSEVFPFFENLRMLWVPNLNQEDILTCVHVLQHLFKSPSISVLAEAWLRTRSPKFNRSLSIDCRNSNICKLSRSSCLAR